MLVVLYATVVLVTGKVARLCLDGNVLASEGIDTETATVGCLDVSLVGINSALPLVGRWVIVALDELEKGAIVWSIRCCNDLTILGFKVG